MVVRSLQLLLPKKFITAWMIVPVLALLTVALAFLRWGLGWGWASGTGFTGKTLWDWLDLLIVPVALGVGAFWLERSERVSDRRIAKERFELEQKLTDQRIESEQDLARDRQRDAALEAYYDKMTALLLDPVHPLRSSRPDDEVRVVARSRTLATLRRLDYVRKGMLVSFLVEAQLAGRDPDHKPFDYRKLTDLPAPVIDLSMADLSEMVLQDIHLSGARLSSSNLKAAYLNGADLKARTWSKPNWLARRYPLLTWAGRCSTGHAYHRVIFGRVTFLPQTWRMSMAHPVSMSRRILARPTCLRPT
jgi:hypothetical protein